MKTLIAFLILTSMVYSGDLKSQIALESAYALLNYKAAIAEKVPRSQCPECKGTGFIDAGDGVVKVKRACENCYDDGKGNGDSVPTEPAPVTEEPTPVTKEPVPVRQILVFSATWCGPCVQFKNGSLAQLRKTGWTDSQIKVIDVDQDRETWRKYGSPALPTMILISDDKELSRHTGGLDPWQVGAMFEGLPFERRMSASELRAWVKAYKGEPAFTEGMTDTQHLLDPAAKEHHKGGPFQAWQLQGLTKTELQMIHGGQHVGVLTPYGVIK